jgi:hypothetical protein
MLLARILFLIFLLSPITMCAGGGPSLPVPPCLYNKLIGVRDDGSDPRYLIVTFKTPSSNHNDTHTVADIDYTGVAQLFLAAERSTQKQISVDPQECNKHALISPKTRGLNRYRKHEKVRGKEALLALRASRKRLRAEK